MEANAVPTQEENLTEGAAKDPQAGSPMDVTAEDPQTKSPMDVAAEDAQAESPMDFAAEGTQAENPADGAAEDPPAANPADAAAVDPPAANPADAAAVVPPAASPADVVVKPSPRKSYVYDERNAGLPLYGVIVLWDRKTKYSDKALLKKLEALLKPFQIAEANANPGGRKSLQRKPTPFLRRVALNKSIAMFKEMQNANSFANINNPEFLFFIPMSFVSTVGMAMFNRTNFKSNELQQFIPPPHEALQWRKKRLEGGKIQVTIAFHGTTIPERLYVRGEQIDVNMFLRKPVYCTRCLRYGHRTGNCIRKPRCGACVGSKPSLKHCEKECKFIRRNEKINRCLYCGGGHTIGSEGCEEYEQQCSFKTKLVKSKMDFLSVLENDILPSIRSTPVNSDRNWYKP